jgi:pimeloyl-[acyl-carrier protein] methyl ester esterase
MTLVLLPGLDGSGDFYDGLCRLLPPHWRTQVVPYPGDQPLSYGELARFVQAVLPDNGPFVLLAESFSGPVAIQVAATRPTGLMGVVLCATFARNPRPVLRPLQGLTRWAPVRAVPMGLLSRWLLGGEADALWAERIRNAMSKCSVAVLRARAQEVLSVDVRSHLADIRVPVLYLQATRDRVVPAAALGEMQRVLPGIQVTEVDGPHFLLQARPAPCAERIVMFAERLAFARIQSTSPQDSSMLLPSLTDQKAIFDYAMSFNAYEHFGSFEAAADVAKRAPRTTLEEVRAELFFKARAARHLGTDLHVKAYAELFPLLQRLGMD